MTRSLLGFLHVSWRFVECYTDVKLRLHWGTAVFYRTLGFIGLLYTAVAGRGASRLCHAFLAPQLKTCRDSMPHPKTGR